VGSTTLLIVDVGDDIDFCRSRNEPGMNPGMNQEQTRDKPGYRTLFTGNGEKNQIRNNKNIYVITHNTDRQG